MGMLDLQKETTKNALTISKKTQGALALAGILIGTVVGEQIHDTIQKKLVIDCRIDSNIDDQTAQEKEKCAAYVNTGKIALIGFDTSPSDITYIVGNANAEVAALYGSNATIVAIPPSDALTEEYETYKETAPNGEKCVSNTRFISEAARQTMADQLRGYNVVIAYTSLPGCEDTYADYPSKYYGSAAYSAHYGDINAFKVADEPQSIETIVHEIGHSYGLNHAGTAVQRNFSPIIVAKARYNEINVTAVLADSTYDEYGEKSTIMGSGYSKNDYPNATVHYPYTLNALQLQTINKITKQPILIEEDLSQTASTRVAAPYNQITSIKLVNALSLHDETTNNTHEYSDIAIVPMSNVHPGIKDKNRLEVYGQNGSLTVFLGYITIDVYNKTVLHFDGQDITIESTEKAALIQSAVL